MPAPRIRAEYDGLERIAKMFLKQAENISNSFKRLSAQAEVLNDRDWVGEGAKKFDNEMSSSVLPSIQGLSQALEESGHVTQKISDLMHQADEDIARLFAVMASGGVAGVASAAAAMAMAQAGAVGAATGAAVNLRNQAVDRVLSKIDPKVRELVKKSPTLASQVQSLEGKVTFRMGPKGSKATYYDPKTKEIVIAPGESTNAQVSSIAHEVGHATYKKIPYHAPKPGMTKAQYIQKNVREQMLDEGSAQMNAAIVRDEIKKAGGPTLGMPGTQEKKYLSAYNDYKSGKISRQQAVGKMADLMGNETTSIDNKPYKQYYAKTYEDHWNKVVGKGKTKR
jgi:WXG100 family type VII secretion target